MQIHILVKYFPKGAFFRKISPFYDGADVNGSKKSTVFPKTAEIYSLNEFSPSFYQ